jgi:hypothetical protein
MSAQIHTLRDCIGVLHAAMRQARRGEDVRLKVEDVHKIIAALEDAEKR